MKRLWVVSWSPALRPSGDRAFSNMLYKRRAVLAFWLMLDMAYVATVVDEGSNGLLLSGRAWVAHEGV